MIRQPLPLRPTHAAARLTDKSQCQRLRSMLATVWRVAAVLRIHDADQSIAEVEPPPRSCSRSITAPAEALARRTAKGGPPMGSSIRLIAGLALLSLTFVPSAALAQLGVTATEIKVGNTNPYSGPLS